MRDRVARRPSKPPALLSRIPATRPRVAGMRDRDPAPCRGDVSRGRVAGMRDRGATGPPRDALRGALCAAPLARRSRRGALCAARSALAQRRPAAGLTRSGSGHRGAVRALFAPVRVSQPCSCFHRSVFPNLLFGQTTDSVATNGTPARRTTRFPSRCPDPDMLSKCLALRASP